MAINLARAREAKASVLQRLPKHLKVNGVGITQVGADYAVKVNLTEPPAEGTDLPREVNGVPVVIEVVGHIVKQAR
jgi:hypothetical protein